MIFIWIFGIITPKQQRRDKLLHECYSNVIITCDIWIEKKEIMHIHSALKQPERRIYKFLVFEKPIIMMLMLLLAPTPPPPSWWETLLATSWGCILYIPYLLGSRSSFSFFFPPDFNFGFICVETFGKSIIFCYAKHALFVTRAYTTVEVSRDGPSFYDDFAVCVRVCGWVGGFSQRMILCCGQ